MAQRGLLLLEEVAGGTNAYNVAQAMRVRGPLDLGALQHSLDELVRRHEVLRTRFLTDGPEGARPVVVPPGRADLTVTRLGARSGRQPTDDEVRAFVREEAAAPFDLASGSLYRGRLAVLGPEDHVLVLVSHHIASDARSKQVLNGELSALYGAFSRSLPSPLPEPTVQYADYAAWVDEHGVDAADLEWWRRRLAGAPEQTDLPVDRPRPARALFRGSVHLQRWPADLSAELSAFATRHRLTTYAVLLAAWTALVERYAGQGEVVVGTNVSGRHDPALDDVVGLFLNTLPVRVDTSGGPGFAVLADRCRQAALDTMRHQSVPFEVLVERLQPSRVPGRNPFFQTTLTWKADRSRVPTLPGLEVTPIPFDGGWSKFDLSLIAFPAGDAIAVAWEFDTDLFDEETVRRLATQLELLVRTALREPDLPITAIRLTTPADERALAAFNDTATGPADRLVHQMVADQVRRTPDAPAVGDRATGWLTYGELDARADRLAHHLVALGVRADDRVGVYLDRSVDLPVTLLAVLRAGGAYVPLDPTYPEDRLAFMVEDCGARLLLTRSALADRAPVHPRTVCVDALDLDDVPAGPPDVGVGPEHLAYVMYTSGTTGRPKGVMVEHGGFASHVRWARDHFGLDASDTILQKTPYSFDVSVWELWLGPVSGCRLFMAEQDRHGDPWYVAEVVEQERVTVLNFVPSVLRAFLGAGVVHRCGGVRLVIACGEVLPDALKDEVLAAIPGLRLENLYGPTEASVTISWDRCQPGEPVTVGRLTDDCRGLVLDEHGQQVPPGMPGELWVGGAQLARGYVNRPDLTAERFVETRHGRLYRTGDRVRWRPDGRLDYLGRLDDQVKLRGFRVELGEIETVLTADPRVAEAAVLIRSGPSGEDLVAAYVVRTPGLPADRLTEGDVAAVARLRLPDYMVPQAVQFLPALPHTPSGKLDRRWLGTLDLPTLTRPHVAPANETEAALARIWERELHLDGPVSTDVSFFELGGNSLVALRIFPVIERELDVRLALSVLFEHVTVASLARVVEAERSNAGPWDTLVTVRRGGDRLPLFALPGLRGEALPYLQIAPHLDGDRPVHAIQARGIDGRARPHTRLEDIGTDSIEAIRRVQPRGPYHLLGYCFGGVLAYDVATRLRAAGEEVAYVGIIEATPFGRGAPSAREKARTRRRRGVRWAASRVAPKWRQWSSLWVSQVLGRLGVEVPRRFVNLIPANRAAARHYVCPDSDLDLTLLLASRGSARAGEALHRRWAAITTGEVQVQLLDSGPVSHVDVVRGDLGRMIAEKVNDSLAGLP